MLQNNRKALISWMRLILMRKTVFVNISPVLLLCTKRVVYNKSKFSFGFSPFRTCWEKQTFQVLLSFFLRESIFWLKRELSSEFSQKFFKTTEKHSLAVYGSCWGKKQFLLIFVPFYLFDQKKLFKQIQIFLRICPFSNWFWKTHFPSISILHSEIINFFIKKRSFEWIFPKILQSDREA